MDAKTWSHRKLVGALLEAQSELDEACESPSGRAPDGRSIRELRDYRDALENEVLARLDQTLDPGT
jgi:hypothetical protein